jgi:hypothetical protein
MIFICPNLYELNLLSFGDLETNLFETDINLLSENYPADNVKYFSLF